MDKLIKSISHPCKILDMSPSGINIYSNVEIGKGEVQPIQIEIQFVLDVTTIRALGGVVWTKPFGKGQQTGIHIID